MQRKNILCLVRLVLVTSLSMSGLLAADTLPSMGVRTHYVEDSSRPHWVENGSRPLLMHAFYPTSTAPEQLTFGPNGQAFFEMGHGQLNAPLDGLKSGLHPLAILSHGNGSGAEQMGWIAQALVASGYIVVALNHHGNSFVEPYMAQGFVHSWERPADVSFAIDWALDESLYKDSIDANKIIAIGFSLGGYTVLANTGPRTDRSYFRDEFCQSSQRDGTCEPQNEFPDLAQRYAALEHQVKALASKSREAASYYDSRIKAVVAIAPPGHLFSPGSLHLNTTPTLLIVGEQDSLTPAMSNARYLSESFENSQLVEIPAAGHFSFVTSCLPEGEKAMEHLCSERYGGNRKRIHQTAIEAIRKFLNSHI